MVNIQITYVLYLYSIENKSIKKKERKKERNLLSKWNLGKNFNLGKGGEEERKGVREEIERRGGGKEGEGNYFIAILFRPFFFFFVVRDETFDLFRNSKEEKEEK